MGYFLKLIGDGLFSQVGDDLFSKVDDELFSQVGDGLFSQVGDMVYFLKLLMGYFRKLVTELNWMSYWLWSKRKAMQKYWVGKKGKGFDEKYGATAGGIKELQRSVGKKKCGEKEM